MKIHDLFLRMEVNKDDVRQSLARLLKNGTSSLVPSPFTHKQRACRPLDQHNHEIEGSSSDVSPRTHMD